MSMKEEIVEMLERITGSHLQKVRLGPAVVGRNSSIAWALQLVMLAGVLSGAYLHSSILVGGSLIGALLGGLWISYLNVTFGKENPAAALLEGAHFLQFHEMQMTALKGAAAVELPSAPPVLPPSQLSGGATPAPLPEHTEPEQ